MIGACRKILVVDDDPAVLRLMKQMLTVAGYEVATSLDGREALAAVETSCPDMVITDWDMPNVDGLELCRRIRLADLPQYVYVFILTGKNSSEDMVRGLEAGANDFLIKPVNRIEMLARLRAGARVLELERRLSDMAHRDMLTGLLTRRSFFEQVTREFARSRRFGESLSCVMLDVDFFKRINDYHGHSVGDAVLQACGKLLKGLCRESDLMCRYGGEEFCAILAHTDERQAVIWADRVRRNLAEQALTVDGKTLRITVSLGVAQLTPDALTPERLIDGADQALLVAKQSGRDRVVTYSSLVDLNQLDSSVERPLLNAFAGVAARDCMTTPVACLDREASVSDAAEFFCQMRVNSAPVVDVDGRLVGIISEKDVLGMMLKPDSWHQTVGGVMQANVVSYEESTPIQKIYEFLCRVTIRRVVIVSQGKPLGIIDRGTLLRWYRNWVQSQGRELSEVLGIDGSSGRPGVEPTRDTVEALIREAGKLQSNLAFPHENLVPIVVGRVTRMQELLNDLLAYSRLNSRIAVGEQHLQF